MYSKRKLVLLSAAALTLFLATSTMAQEPEDEIQDVDRKVAFTPRTILGFIMASFFVLIAAGGGIGGGGVLVPTFIFVFGFEPKVAIPLSTITIFGSSVTNCILNSRKRHPLANRPLIDWDMMLVMEPLTIAGTVIGSFMNVMLPPWVLCVMLVILLSMTTVKTMKKGLKMYKKESAERDMVAYEQFDNVNVNGNQQQIMPEQIQNNVGVPPHDIHGAAPMYNKGSSLLHRYSKELDDLLKRESVHPWQKIAAMIILTGGVLGLSIMKGGHSINPLNIVCGEWEYWLISLSVVPFVLIISILARNHLVSVFHLKESLGYEYVDGDVEWNERNTIVYPLVCSIAGLCAGLFGIGGGIVKGPLMLEMGVSPKVASATSATMILLTSSAAAVSYLLFNALNVNFAPVLFCTGLCFTLVGQKLLNHLVKKYNRSSLIILVIGITVGASAIAMSISSGSSIVHLLQGHTDPPSSLCA